MPQRRYTEQQKGAGISIITSGAKLPPRKQAMVRAWEKSTFRHPVFGNDDVWVAQSGDPYFYTALDHHLPSMRQAMAAALTDAVEQIERAT